MTLDFLIIMKLTIITINYNNRDGLQKTIDSIVCQTWRDFEWIVIDGGSTDGSKELIEQYKHYFVYWCSEPDKGVYNAMNKGIVKAQGEYLNFMNSGDCFYSKYTLQKVFSEDLSADIVSGLVMLSDGTRLYQYQENIVRLLVCDSICHQSSFFKRKLFDNSLYREDYRIVSDWIALVEWLLLEKKSLYHIDVTVAVYDITGISSEKGVIQAERNRYLSDRFGLIGKELPVLYKEFDHLKGELNIPAVNMLRYLYYDAPRWFSIMYRLISFVVMLKDFLFRTSSYKFFRS